MPNEKFLEAFDEYVADRVDYHIENGLVDRVNRYIEDGLADRGLVDECGTTLEEVSDRMDDLLRDLEQNNYGFLTEDDLDLDPYVQYDDLDSQIDAWADEKIESGDFDDVLNETTTIEEIYRQIDAQGQRIASLERRVFRAEGMLDALMILERVKEEE